MGTNHPYNLFTRWFPEKHSHKNRLRSYFYGTSNEYYEFPKQAKDVVNYQYVAMTVNSIQ